MCFSCLLGVVLSSAFYGAIPGYLTTAHKCAFSPVAVPEDCLARRLSTRPVCTQSLHGERILLLLHYTHTYTQNLKLESVGFVFQGRF